ncbi:MAG TPA: aromatic amino acid lyase [Actinomycetota bacterium]|nr:aromatic amino acid lyase [Actinomycetota bacterium]
MITLTGHLDLTREAVEAVAWEGIALLAGSPLATALALARRLAAPASVGQAETSLGQEDAASFAPEVAEQLRRVQEPTREAVVCELLTARQAWWLRDSGGSGPGARWTGPAPGLRPLAACLEELVAPVDRTGPSAPTWSA